MSIVKLNSLDYKESKEALKVARDHIANLQIFTAKVQRIVDDVIASDKVFKPNIEAVYKEAKDALKAQCLENKITKCKSLSLEWRDEMFLKEIKVTEENKKDLRMQNELATEDEDEERLDEIDSLQGRIVELETKLANYVKDVEVYRENMEGSDRNLKSFEEKLTAERSKSERFKAELAIKEQTIRNLRTITSYDSTRLSTIPENTVVADTTIANSSDSTLTSGGYKTDYGKPRRLDAKTPVFGKDRSITIDQWMTVVENNFDIDKIGEDNKVKVCLPYLRGSAFEMCKKAITAKTGWDTFKKKLLRHFLPVYHLEKIRQKLLELKQTGSYDDFVEEFQNLSSQVPDMPEEILFSIFVKGINKATRLEIETKEIKNLEDAMDFASRLEYTKGEKSNVSDKKRFFSSGNANKSPNKTITCYTCGKKGHSSKGCYSNRKNGNGNLKVKKYSPDVSRKVHFSTNSNNQMSSENKKKCWSCGSYNHLTED